eukprot:Phypoly_transcript_16021.p1 GENE.Phypoly_transcript_16021~~Phypoly_transcript_16021.p1  ORF type:complete len:191 (-),score=19.36 Phypoly_transcript_16021:190-762(-)
MRAENEISLFSRKFTSNVRRNSFMTGWDTMLFCTGLRIGKILAQAFEAPHKTNPALPSLLRIKKEMIKPISNTTISITQIATEDQCDLIKLIIKLITVTAMTIRRPHMKIYRSELLFKNAPTKPHIAATMETMPRITPMKNTPTKKEMMPSISNTTLTIYITQRFILFSVLVLSPAAIVVQVELKPTNKK